MFLQTLRIERVTEDGLRYAVPIRHLDSFSMRNFTNDAVFDDTLPVADGRLEAGSLVPLELLQTAMQQWFRRKQYLKEHETLTVTLVES